MRKTSSLRQRLLRQFLLLALLPVVVVSGEQAPDADLMERSTVSAGIALQTHTYLAQGGVENLRQMEVLHRLGCGLMQGFLFSRPQPPDVIETWLAQTVLPRKAPWIVKAEDAGLGDVHPGELGHGPDGDRDGGA